MTYAAWVLGVGLLTVVFSGILERQHNPNRDVRASREPDGGEAVVLRANRAGHYLARGAINGYPVTFLVDTGATDVAVPQGIAQRVGLEPLFRTRSRTAAGDVDTWSTLLRSVDLAGIRMYAIPATILPDMPGDEVLLGMSFLERLEMIQRDGVLTLRLH
jgi:aspartyl protease family protein